MFFETYKTVNSLAIKYTEKSVVKIPIPNVKENPWLKSSTILLSSSSSLFVEVIVGKFGSEPNFNLCIHAKTGLIFSIAKLIFPSLTLILYFAKLIYIGYFDRLSPYFSILTPI